MDETIAQEQVDQLAEHASYMKDEAEALTYVIDEVPHQEQVPDQPSIAERLIFIDHVQKNYYRATLEKAIEDSRPTRTKSIRSFIEGYEPNNIDPDKDIQSLLTSVAKHRAGLVNSIKNVPTVEWSKAIYVADKKQHYLILSSKLYGSITVS